MEAAVITDALGRAVLGGGGSIPVEVQAIGKELRRLWQASDQAGGTIVRACTRNLIALARNDEEALFMSQAIAHVVDRHPARAFLVHRDSGGEADRLEASLTAHCRVRGEGRHVCCEQIELSVGSAAGRRAAAAIGPLLVPDLPVFVWVMGDPPWQDELFERLLDVADRLLVDSTSASDPEQFLADLFERRTDRWAPADFTWGRLAPWREAVASCFDDAGGVQRACEVELVEIAHESAGAAALLAGWILDRVDAARAFEPAGLAARVAAADGAGEPVPVRVVLNAGAGAPQGTATTVRIALSKNTVVWSIQCPGDGRALTLDTTASHAGSHRHRLPRPVLSPDLLLEDGLDEPFSDPLYERALLRAATILSGTSPD